MPTPRSFTARILLHAFRPAVSIAVSRGVDLETFSHLAERALFEYLRDKGESYPVIARRLGKSQRTIAEMAKRFREDSISKELVDEGLVLNELYQRLSSQREVLRSQCSELEWTSFHEKALQNQALYDLSVTDERIALPPEQSRRDAESDDRRIEMLGAFLETVANVIEARFPRPGQKTAPALLRLMWTRVKPNSVQFAQGVVDTVNASFTELYGSVTPSEGVGARVAVLYFEDPKQTRDP